jgi:hypothetical protein
MFGRSRRRPEVPAEAAAPAPSLSDEQQRQAFHEHSEPIPTRPVRTVLVDVTTDQQRGFWDAPLWMPVGGVIEGGDDLWEIVSVRLRLPTSSASDGVRPVLYLYARKAEA